VRRQPDFAHKLQQARRQQASESMKTDTAIHGAENFVSPIRNSSAIMMHTVIADSTAKRMDDPTTCIRRSMMRSSLTTR
jgi:hypothetical protein